MERANGAAPIVFTVVLPWRFAICSTIVPFWVRPDTGWSVTKPSDRIYKATIGTRLLFVNCAQQAASVSAGLAERRRGRSSASCYSVWRSATRSASSRRSPDAVIEPSGNASAAATLSRSGVAGIASFREGGDVRVTVITDTDELVVLSRQVGLSELKQRCEVEVALRDGVEFIGNAL